MQGLKHQQSVFRICLTCSQNFSIICAASEARLPVWVPRGGGLGRPGVPLSPLSARQQRMLLQLMALPPLTDNATRDTLLCCALCCGIDVRQVG